LGAGMLSLSVSFLSGDHCERSDCYFFSWKYMLSLTNTAGHTIGWLLGIKSIFQNIKFNC